MAYCHKHNPLYINGRQLFLLPRIDGSPQPHLLSSLHHCTASFNSRLLSFIWSHFTEHLALFDCFILMGGIISFDRGGFQKKIVEWGGGGAHPPMPPALGNHGGWHTPDADRLALMTIQEKGFKITCNNMKKCFFITLADTVFNF